VGRGNPNVWDDSLALAGSDSPGSLWRNGRDITRSEAHVRIERERLLNAPVIGFRVSYVERCAIARKMSLAACPKARLVKY
jgi:hypothetical protein